MKTPIFSNESMKPDDYQYQNIKSSSEAAFADVTRLAACVCQTPIAILCLVNSKRCWIKSQVGIAEGVADSYLALCTETLLQTEIWNEDILLVEDTSKSQWFAKSELVKSQQLRFYVSIPLFMPQGLLLGILTIIDRIPRQLTPQQQELLLALCRQAIAQLELRKIATNLKIVVSNIPQLPEQADVDAQPDSTNNKQVSVNISASPGSTVCGAKWQKMRQIRGDLVQKSVARNLKSRNEMASALPSPDRLTRNTVWREAYHFFTLSPDILCVMDGDGKIKRVNPAFENILGYAAEELLAKSFFDFVHPEDKTSTKTEWETLDADTSSIHCENRYLCQDGSYKELAWSIFGQVEETLIYAIARELPHYTKATLLKRSHSSTLEADVGAALVGQSGTLSARLKRCTEAMVKHLDAIGVGIWTVDANNSLHLDLQASSGKLIPANFPQHISPNHELFGVITQTRQSLSTQLQTQGCDVEHEGCSDNYSFFSGYPLIIESRLVGVIALHSCQPFSEVVESVLSWVANAIAVAIDRAWAREELLSRREALLFRLANQIRNSLDLNTILGTAVTEIRNLLGIDGCYFLWCWFEVKQPSIVITHEACNPELPSLLGECPPQYLPRLAQKIRKLETLCIDDLAASNLDSKTRSLLSNTGLASALLLPLKTTTGQLGAIVCSHYHDIRPWSDHEVELLQAVVDQLAIAIEHAELFAKTRAAALAAQTQARQLEIAVQDLQQTESRLLQTEKMSSLGQMVAGIAHEINNPVSFITGNLTHANNYIQDLLNLINCYQEYYPSPLPDIQDYIEEIDLEFILEDLPKILTSMQMGADRIHEIVISLRNFSRADEAQMKPINIHEGIDNTLLILHNRLKPSGKNPGIMIVKEYGKLPLVECYAGQLNQVFMNIISNAIDALEYSPEPTKNITICTAIWTEDLEPNSSQPPTSWVVTRIRDNGPGMPAKVANHLFEPFFTTKPVGKGTGLGLSISYQIVVEKHGGILKCISEPGKGTEFWIQIPLVLSETIS